MKATPVNNKIKNKKSNINNTDNKDKAYCRMCQDYKPLTAFYEATNPMLDINGKMSICKEHCTEIYNLYFSIHNNLEKALQLTCEALDVCYNQQALKETKSHIEKLVSQGKKAEAVFGYYKSKLGSTGKNNANIDAFRYKDSDISFANEQNIINENTNTYISQSDFELTDEIIKYWGKGRDLFEYDYLDEQLFKIKTSFECPDYGMEMLMRDICFINLDIEKVRQGAEKGDISKLIETRSKLMNDAKMKPIQATGAEANEQITFGTLIKKWENEKPIPKDLDDEMKKYIDTYMVGHLAKMQGLNCDLVDKYEKSLKEFTIDFDDLSNEEDE